MEPDFNKRTRLAIQDFNKLSLLEEKHLPITREASCQPRTTYKKSMLNDFKSERRSNKLDYIEGRKLVSSKGPSTWAEPEEYEFSRKKVVMLPQQSFESTSSREADDNPEERMQTYSSIRLNKVSFHRIEKNISERYQKKMEMLKQLKIPKISQQLITISHFTHEALNSIPKHEQIFNEKLKMLRKSVTPASETDKYQKKKEADTNQMPQELKTLRVIRKQLNKNDILSSRKTHDKFRMYLTKKPTKKQINHQIFRIEGWQEQRSTKDKNLFD